MDTLVFAVEGHRFGLPAEDVREIARLDVLRHLPHAARCVEGEAQIAGRSVVVVDARAVLGLPTRTARRGDLLVVVAAGRAHVALRVDAAAGFAADDDDATTAGLALFPDVAAWVSAEHLMAPARVTRRAPHPLWGALLSSLTLHLVPRFR